MRFFRASQSSGAMAPKKVASIESFCEPPSLSAANPAAPPSKTDSKIVLIALQRGHFASGVFMLQTEPGLSALRSQLLAPW